MFDFTYVNALTLADATTALGQGNAPVIAGDTDL